jgi:hypothetical protein
MVNTAHSFKSALWLSHAVFMGATMVPFGATALAQSSGALASVPYLPGSIPMASDGALVPAAAKPYKGPPPVVMFRAKAVPQPAASPSTQSDEPPIQFVPPPPLEQSDAPERRYSIANTAERDAASAGWNPASLEAVVAPPMVASGAEVISTPMNSAAGLQGARPYRSPMRRILQDTKRSLTRDLPEAVADALPWVDRDAKNEPFNEVLGRVADDLHRAASADPEWALPAQREIRALSQRLDMLPSPPSLAQGNGDSRPVSVAAGIDDRPFRARPIWPGASGRPETQVRPVTLVTATGQQAGPAATGVAARYVPAAEDDDGMPVVQQTPPRRRTGARGVPRAGSAPKAR